MCGRIPVSYGGTARGRRGGIAAVPYGIRIRTPAVILPRVLRRAFPRRIESVKQGVDREKIFMLPCLLRAAWERCPEQSA